jgi:hypothetical protein
MLSTQSNLAFSYSFLGRNEEALRVNSEVYSGRLKLNGEENAKTIAAANNYASSLGGLQRLEEAKSLLLRILPVARRALGEAHETTLQMRWNYALALYMDAGATLDDLREAVATLEDAERIALRVLGGAHPLTGRFEFRLQEARAALAARETPSASA